MKSPPVILLLSLALSGAALADPPANDAFSAATAMVNPLGGQTYESGAFTNNAATFESGESALALPADGTWTGSAWWSLTVPQTGTYYLGNAYTGNGSSNGVQVFEGTSLGSLTPAPVTRELAYLTAGQPYRVRRLTNSSMASASFFISRRAELDPVSDKVAQAVVIPWPEAQGGVGSADISTVGATAEPGEPAHGGVPAQRTAWVKFTAGTTGAVGLTVSFQRWQLPGGKFELYEEAPLAALSPLTPVQEIPGIGTIQRYRVYAVTAGKTYLLAVNDTQDVFSGIRIQVARLGLARFPNDDFASRTRVEPDVFGPDHSRFPSSNYIYYYGSLEAGEPAMPAGYAGATESLWWDFVPAATGWYATGITDGSNLEVFKGTSLQSLVPLTNYVTRPSSPDYTVHQTYVEHPTRYYHFEAGEPVIFRQVLSGAGWSHTLVSPAKGYELFALESGLPAAQWNYAANPAGDGYDNLTKYLHGLNPAKFAGTDPREGHLPHVVKNGEGGMDLVFTVDLVALEQLRDTWDRVELRMITSTDLTSWQYGLPLSLYAGSGEEDVRFKEFRFPLPAGAARMFVKMGINVVHEHDL